MSSRTSVTGAQLNRSIPWQNAQGTFTFVKDTTGSEQTGLSNGGFTNVSITLTPGAEPPDTFVYDLAVCLNDWCIDPSSGRLDDEPAAALLFHAVVLLRGR